MSDSELARLSRLVADLKRAGRAVLYVPSTLNEVFTLADRFTVLRDGRSVATATPAETTPDALARWIHGAVPSPKGAAPRRGGSCCRSGTSG